MELASTLRKQMTQMKKSRPLAPFLQ